MQYEGDIYRPPSEARSLLIQLTIGCAWNKCTFCDMYAGKKFRIRPLADVQKDLEECAVYADRVRRIFLCDGDALAVPYENLVAVLQTIRRLYPHLEGVRVYASAKDVLHKSPEQLAELRALGLDMVYIGLESGSDKVLQAVNKGITKQQMVDAAAKLHNAGIHQSISIIAGLGGPSGWQEHMTETADALNAMQPEYLGLLVLMPRSDADVHTARQSGAEVPDSEQVLREMRLLLEKLELRNCNFSSAHVSNYLNIKGSLPGDRDKLLRTIDSLLAG